LPSAEAELSTLAKKMGFYESQSFAYNLEMRRRDVRDIFDSLFADQKEEVTLSRTFFDEEFSDSELREYLANRGLKDVSRAARNIKSIKDCIYTFQTLRGRKLLGNILPVFVDFALESSSPDMSLNHLQSFSELLSSRESYLEIFSENKELIEMLTYVFSQSEYLSKIIMGKPQYLEMIGMQESSNKTLNSLKDEIKNSISEGISVNDAIRLIKQTEEMRLGLLYLRKKIGIVNVIKSLSKTAEAILDVAIEHVYPDAGDMAVIGLGKIGGREITFNADLDVFFVSQSDTKQEITKAAQKFLRMLISHTKEGFAYRVDTRLRPEGSKGPLVPSVESFRKYYAKAAAFWELQALLKARPIAGNIKTGKKFIRMAMETLTVRGREISASDIKQMRKRIMKELSKEQEGYDIKLGPGGIEEIEFIVQYLQLANCHKNSKLLVQGTLDAIRRLNDAGVITNGDADSLKENYIFLRTLESFLRLRGETLLKREVTILKDAAEFIEFGDAEELLDAINRRREQSKEIAEKYLTDKME
jgi:glutamate-ammonia-ligase adenylyltransferase